MGDQEVTRSAWADVTRPARQTGGLRGSRGTDLNPAIAKFVELLHVVTLLSSNYVCACLSIVSFNSFFQHT